MGKFMKNRLFLLLYSLISVHYLQASVTYQQILTAISQRNGDQCQTLVTAALAQANRYCVFQGLLQSGIDLTVMVNFNNCALFTNNVSVCTNNFTVFCDTCCTYNNTPGNTISGRFIDVCLILSVLLQAYEITQMILTAYPDTTVNIANITNNWTLLMWASQLDDLPTAKLLIKRGADITACSNTGLSPIKLAEINGSQNMINLLIYTDLMQRMKTA